MEKAKEARQRQGRQMVLNTPTTLTTNQGKAALGVCVCVCYTEKATEARHRLERQYCMRQPQEAVQT